MEQTDRNSVELSLEDRRYFFIMTLLTELDLPYNVFKELFLLLFKSEKLITCVDFYLKHNKGDN